MKKYIIAALVLFSLSASAQTVQQRAGFYSNGQLGKIFNDTVYTLPRTAGQYWNGYGNFVTLRDSVLAAVTSLPGRATGDMYYDNGGAWARLPIGTAAQALRVVGGVPVWRDTAVAGGGGGSGWALTGNTGTNPTTNWIGTNDFVNLRFKARNVFSGQIDSTMKATFFGYGSGNIGTLSGDNNTGYGFKALSLTTTGVNNTGIGTTSLQKNTTGTDNTGVGHGALFDNLTGTHNSALGSNALNKNTGSSNASVGALSMTNNTSGSSNVAVGAYALTNNTTSNDNTAVGNYALSANTNNTFNNNTAVGSSALRNAVARRNTAVGFNSLLGTNSGEINTAIGAYSGQSNTSGNYNVFLGYFSGAYNTTGVNQIFIDNQNRVSYAGDTTGAPIYAVANTTVAQQKVRLNGNVGINMAGHSTLSVNGSFATAYTATAASLTASVSHSTIDVTATGQTITLPTAVGISGRVYTVKLTASGTGTVATTSSQTIDGATTYSLAAQYKYVTVQSTGANWIIIAQN